MESIGPVRSYVSVTGPIAYLEVHTNLTKGPSEVWAGRCQCGKMD